MMGYSDIVDVPSSRHLGKKTVSGDPRGLLNGKPVAFRLRSHIHPENRKGHLPLMTKLSDKSLITIALPSAQLMVHMGHIHLTSQIQQKMKQTDRIPSPGNSHNHLMPNRRPIEIPQCTLHTFVKTTPGVGTSQRRNRTDGPHVNSFSLSTNVWITAAASGASRSLRRNSSFRRCRASIPTTRRYSVTSFF